MANFTEVVEMVTQQATEKREFIPSWGIVNEIPAIMPDDWISSEPMYYQAEPEFVRANGGYLSDTILDFMRLEIPDGYNALVDSRVTHTMKGYYPAIPGWHCDNVPRSETYSQPDFSKIDPNCWHYMCNIATSRQVSNTEFLASPVKLWYSTDNVWSSIDKAMQDKEINRLCKPPKTKFIKPGQIVKFSQTDLHRATPCIEPGWRLFFRVSITKKKPVNQIRKQVQVYITGDAGW